MVSFEDTRTWLLIAHDEGDIDDEEFLLLYNEYTSKNPSFSHEDKRFDLDDMECPEWYAEFRVKKNDITLLAEALEIPDKFVCNQRSICGGMEGLCILLKRLAYPCRYSDMMH